jgi:small-conductance mechanosensitive channel
MKHHSASIFLLLVIALLFITAPPADGEETGAQDRTPVMLRFFNHDITTLRGEFSGYGPRLRASSFEARISSALARGGPGRVTVEPESSGVFIKVDGEGVVRILNSDLDTLNAETFDDKVNQTVANLNKAIASYIESRNKGAFWRGVLYCAVALLVYLVIAFISFRIKDWLIATFDEKILKFLQKHFSAFIHADRMQRLKAGMATLVKVLNVLLQLFFLDILVTFCLNQFPYTRPWAKATYVYLLKLVSNILGDMVAMIPNIMVIIVILAVARLLQVLANLFFSAVERKHVEIGWLDEETVIPTRRIAALIIWLFAFAMLYPYLPGSGSDAFKGLSVMAGLMITIGSSGLVSQMVSGLILIYTKAMRTGDYVKVGDVEGFVMNIGVFAVKLRSFTKEEISLPNTLVLGSSTRNFSRSGAVGTGIALVTGVTIGYDTPWRQVEAMLLEAAEGTDGLLPGSEPAVQILELADFYVSYRLITWIASPETKLVTLTELNTNILDVFNKYGVQIMSPHYEFDPDGKVVVPAENWYDAPALKPDREILEQARNDHKHHHDSREKHQDGQEKQQDSQEKQQEGQEKP